MIERCGGGPTPLSLYLTVPNVTGGEGKYGWLYRCLSPVFPLCCISFLPCTWPSPFLSVFLFPFFSLLSFDRFCPFISPSYESIYVWTGPGVKLVHRRGKKLFSPLSYLSLFFSTCYTFTLSSVYIHYYNVGISYIGLVTVKSDVNMDR